MDSSRTLWWSMVGFAGAVMAWFVVLIAMMLWPPAAQANEVSDRVVACNRIAMGALFRVQGHAGVVKWFKPGSLPAKLEDFSPEQLAQIKTGIFIRDDGETGAEKSAWEDALMSGYRIEDQYISQHGGQIMEPKQVLERCMRVAERESKLDAPHRSALRHVASSEALAAPFTTRDKFCAYRAEIMHRAAASMHDYKTTADLFHDNPLPDSWSSEFRAIAKRDIEDVYGFVGESEVLIRTRYQQCMGMT